MQRRRANRYPRTWTARSRSKGSDSMASKSNRVRPNQIGRFWVLGARGGGGTLPEQSSAAVARRSSPRVVLRGSLRPVLGSGAFSVLRVMHLGQNRVRRGSARRAWLPRRLCAAELAGAVRAGCACARLWRKGIRKALRSKCKTTRLTRGGVVLRRRGHGGAAAGNHRWQCSANRVAHGPNFLAKKEARGSRVLT